MRAVFRVSVHCHRQVRAAGGCAAACRRPVLHGGRDFRCRHAAGRRKVPLGQRPGHGEAAAVLRRGCNRLRLHHPDCGAEIPAPGHGLDHSEHGLGFCGDLGLVAAERTLFADEPDRLCGHFRSRSAGAAALPFHRRNSNEPGLT